MQPDAVRRRLESLPALSAQGKRVNGLFRLLASPVIWEMAYESIAANKGATTPGHDGRSLDGYSPERARRIIARLMEGSYRFAPARRVNIPRASGGTRPLGIPSGDDKLVQAACRLILERIYEPVFSERSHGFRPGRSPHTALEEIRRTWTGASWLVEVDVESFFDSIDHRFLLDLIERRVEDKRFLRLLRSMLKAGYVEEWSFHRTYSGNPQGGVISPLLANVYLHELDQFMQRLTAEYNRGKRRRNNPEWSHVASKLFYARRRAEKVKAAGDDEGFAAERTRIQELETAQLAIPSKDPFDPTYRRLLYCRYADDFLIGVIGSWGEAVEILGEVRDFLAALGLSVSEAKTGVVRATEGVRFLGYDVRTYDYQAPRRMRRNGRVMRKRPGGSGRVQLHVPPERLRAFCREREYGDFDRMESVSKTKRLHLSDTEVVMAFNAEMHGLANYYALAHGAQSGPMARLYYVWRYSLLKTLAHKRGSSVRKVIRHMKGADGRLSLPHEVNGTTRRVLVWELRDLKRTPKGYDAVDEIVVPMELTASRTELVERLNAGVCELCGAADRPCEVHHVRRLADLKGGALWRLVKAGRQRKRFVVCVDCHHGIHKGKLPDRGGRQ